MTQKRKPTYDLLAFKTACKNPDKLNMTATAMRNAIAIRFGAAEIAAMIQTMRQAHFFKSMTASGDSRIWQDVYHVPSVVGILYVTTPHG